MGPDGNILSYIALGQFDVASDAFATLRELLLTHKKTAAQFLAAEGGHFFLSLLRILRPESKDYLTKRLLLRLLGELLHDRNFYEVGEGGGRRTEAHGHITHARAHTRARTHVHTYTRTHTHTHTHTHITHTHTHRCC